MTHNVCVITGTRAEFGLLFPLIKKIESEKELNLQLVVTGSHLSSAFGNTIEEIEKTGIPIFAKIPVNLDGDTKADMAFATGKTMSSFADFFRSNKPDLLIVLGDRYEIFAASAAAALIGIPIAHIHGGETTEGAVDEFLRHSITKMSYLHFTACEEYRKRVIQLGESPDRVFNVGALGVENVLGLPLMSRESLSENLNFDLSGDYAIVTLHSVTQENNTSGSQISELIKAMDSFPKLKFIITKANADSGGRLINSIWETESKKHNNWILVASLGAKRYLTALKYSKMMIGNSSSGILEAPAMHVPTVNIGDRQKGRMMAKSVILCESDAESIINAINTALSKEFNSSIESIELPFGDGKTSERIVEIINEFFVSGYDIKKKFYDLT